LEAVSSPKVLHIATHGYYVDPPKRAAPVKLSEELNKKAKYRFLRSGLILGQEKGGNTDNGGIVTSLEIALLNLRATDLVVLSACDSGVGDTTPGDNVSGLRSAFHIAGAKAVISSLWSVNDEAGQELMEKFYKNLAKGKAGKMLTINQALREAKLEMIGTETPRHPYYWASFVMEGKDDVLFPQLSNN
jgi:CHAT domain-containing protein